MTATKICQGFNMMPFRPVDNKLRANFIYAWDATDWAYDAIVDSPSPCVRFINPYFWSLEEAARKKLDANCVPADFPPMPRNPERFLTYMKKLRIDKPDIRILHYAVGDLHADYDPVFIDQSDKWKGAADKLDEKSVYEFLTKHRGELRRICGWDPDFNDYKVFALVYWAEKMGYEGYYWDDQMAMWISQPKMLFGNWA